MTVLDEKIQLSLEKIGVSWYPFYIQDGKAVVPQEVKTPACIQGIEDKWELLDNGNILQTMDFYMFDRRRKDVTLTTIKEDIMVKQQAITQLIIQFLKEANRGEFVFRLVGQPFKSHDNTKFLDVGQDFTLTVEYLPCQI